MALKRTMFLLFTLVFTLSIIGCEGNAPSRNYDVSYGSGSVNLSDIVSYRSDSPYRDVLKKCVSIRFVSESCSLSTLPLLGQESSSPSVDDVMNRVVVSHSWMGNNFEQVLASLPSDLLLLLRSVTAIVIDADIQPAFYDSTSGAIYLDPSFLWLTVAEKRTLPPRADFRDDYGNGLQFVDLWRYVKQNDWAWDYYKLTDNSERTLADIQLSFARLMYHELAHANDFAPFDQMGLFNNTDSIYQATSNIQSQWLSSRLVSINPLSSEALKQIAQVKFAGQTPTVDQRGYSPAYVGALFQSDGADMLYNYTSQHEDFSLLFEETMMKYHYGAELDVAFSDNLQGDQWVCDDYQVAWGQRNRIASALVKPRAEIVANQLLPTIDWQTFFSSDVGTTIQMGSGGWCENLVLTATPASTRTKAVGDANAAMPMPRENLRPPH